MKNSEPLVGDHIHKQCLVKVQSLLPYLKEVSAFLYIFLAI